MTSVRCIAHTEELTIHNEVEETVIKDEEKITLTAVRCKGFLHVEYLQQSVCWCLPERAIGALRVYHSVAVP